MRNYFIFLILLFGSALSQINPTPGLGDYRAPFYNSTDYLNDIQNPSEWLGFELGGRPVTPAEAFDYIDYLGEISPNAELVQFGATYEGRPLAYLIVSSPDNFNNLDGVKADIRALADPRNTSSAKAEQIIAATPAVALMSYTIHGDELSGTDAALFLAYQLVAGDDAATNKIRAELVVMVNPLQNPDGRQRYTAQMVQWNGRTVNDDNQSLAHSGSWPWGRGNHYFFDLNRDWIILEHPETRAGVRLLTEWYPQLVVDGHEMGSMDTYLFNPPREPFNPYLYSKIHKWWGIFSRGQAQAFDNYGWSYYTREWNEEVYPGYGSSWPLYQGAVGILYEQAGVEGSQIKRYDGITMSYRESVHHQFVSSWANLVTAAERRTDLLRDFYNERRTDSASPGKKASKPAFVFIPGENVSRMNQFLDRLDQQDVEIFTTNSTVRAKNLLKRDGKRISSLNLPKGSYYISLNQPNRDRVEAGLTFDIRLSSEFLELERKTVLKHNDSKLYEVTGWSMPLAYDLEAYYIDNFQADASVPWAGVDPAGRLVNPGPKYGYAFSNADDNSYLVLAQLFQAGLRIRCSLESFTVDGRQYPRGSYLIRRDTNSGVDESVLQAVAASTGINIYGINTALAEKGVDLGGNDFEFLHSPRIAILGGSPISTTSFSSIWYLIDNQLGAKVSILETAGIRRTDLRKYNVIVLPSSWGGIGSYRSIIGEDGLKKLKSWAEAGGTLIGIGNGAALLADSSVAVSAVKRQRQVLKDLPVYRAAQEYAAAAESPRIDSLNVWEGKKGSAVPAKESSPVGDLEKIKNEDELARKLAPSGVIIKGIPDPEHWLSYGLGKSVPLLVYTSNTYLAKSPVQVPVRYAGEADIRMSGLLWPEARKRWADSAYATRERLGRGQVILFAGDPYFRAYFHGGKRLILNALLLGPGFGTRPAPEW